MSARITIEQCPACLEPWSADPAVRLPVEGLADEMLSGSLKELLAELIYDRCRRCQSLIAVDNRRDARLLDEIYRNLPESYWDLLNPQTHFGGVLERYLARRCSGGDLWDIGCGRGNLLQHLGARWTKHGIEPGLKAVATANEKGLEVIAGTAASLRLENVADAALMIDVAEHLPQPRIELAAVARMLRPGGVLAVFTGAADAPCARLAGSRWYYLHCIGHVTILSRTALRGLLAGAGLVEIESHRVEHPGAVSLRRWIGRAMGNVLRRAIGRRPAAMHYYHDHQLVIASKPH